MFKCDSVWVAALAALALMACGESQGQVDSMEDAANGSSERADASTPGPDEDVIDGVTSPIDAGSDGEAAPDTAAEEGAPEDAGAADDADAAVEGAIMCKFRNNGQTCVCANRIYVQAGVYDAFAEKLAAAVQQRLASR